jgi:hypothetical protein
MDSRRTLRTALLALPLLAAVPVSGAAQTNGSGAGVGQILMGMRNGGGWVGIPIEDGKGTFSTVTLPTAAMSVAGCVNVWWGHSGTFEIQAHERVLGSNLRIEAEPGIGVPFEHDFGMTAQVDFEFTWSEPRDTTLMLWVGLDPTLDSPEQACEPEHG